MILPPALRQPQSWRAESSAQFATGLGAIPTPSTLNNSMSRSFNTRSTGYLDTKRELDKTRLFLRYDGQVLRFLCVEVRSPTPPYFPALEERLEDDGQDLATLYKNHGFVASANVKRYAFSYYLATGNADLLVQRRSGERELSLDEPKILLKKTQIPRNWREVQSFKHTPIYYDPVDFRCGQVIDIYGRHFLLVSCDSATHNAFQDLGIIQEEVSLVPEPDERLPQPLPEVGEGLNIGHSYEESGLRQAKDMGKMSRNTNRYLRGKAVLLTNNTIDASRSFLITFFLEDDSLQVYEDTSRNAGIWGGAFLKRGKYLNELPPDSDTARPLIPTDIYLGGVIVVNGYQFRITEMDNMSLKFCENYPDEFPMSDTFRILGLMMLKIVELQIDIRPVFVKAGIYSSVSNTIQNYSLKTIILLQISNNKGF
jgi:hypothetical protein